MTIPSRTIMFGVLVLVILAGMFLLFSVLESEEKDKGGELWPNRRFVVLGKSDFKWVFRPGEAFRFVFQGRQGPEQGKKDVYDPESWSLRFHAEEPGLAGIEFFDGPMRIFQARMKPDGAIRVRSYTDYAESPTEFWQILMNMYLHTPKQAVEHGEIREETFQFPSPGKHKIHGTATFEGEGTVRLGGAEEDLVKIKAFIRVQLEVLPKGDRLTEYVAEGRLYWSPSRSMVVAGEYEYGLGLPQERFLSAWRYVSFTLAGSPFPPAESDTHTRGMQVSWAWVQDITGEERKMMSCQKAARDKLANIGDVQEDFREMALVDQDGDGKGEFGLLTEITGRMGTRLRTDGGKKPWPNPRPKLKIQEWYGQVNAKGFSTVDDYHYQVFLAGHGGLVTDGAPSPDGDKSHADLQEDNGGWCGYSWPMKWGRTGKTVYFSDGKGRVWESSDYVLDGEEKAPRPKDTARPREGTWKRVSRLDPLPHIPWKLEVIRGDFSSSRVESLIGEIQTYRFTLDDLALSKGLRAEDFENIESVNRAFALARGDGEIDAGEAEAARDGYARTLRDIYLLSAEMAFRAGARLAEEAGREDLKEAILAEASKAGSFLRGRPDVVAVKRYQQKAQGLQFEADKARREKKR